MLQYYFICHKNVIQNNFDYNIHKSIGLMS